MKCMSCQNELKPGETKIFNTILLCTQCQALAEKAEREVTLHIERARQMAKNWLEQHILRGGLLAGGSGDGAARAAGLQVRVQAPVQELQGSESPEAAGVPAPDRK